MRNQSDSPATRNDLLRRMPQDATADEVQAGTSGTWLCWYGHATKHYWAMPLSPHPWDGWVEGDTPESLTARIAAVDYYHGQRERP